MSAALDELCPPYLKDQRFSLQLAPDQATPTAGRALRILCSYTNSLPQGPVCPLIFEAKGPSSLGYERRVYTTPPTWIVWRPREGGLHQLTLREDAHNRWFGVLKVEVAGESLSVG